MVVQPQVPRIGSPWPWLSMIFLLGVSIVFPLEDHGEIWISPGYFLPVLAGWLGSRYGIRAVGPVLVASSLVVIGLMRDVTNEFFGARVYLGHHFEVILLSLATVAAFTRKSEAWEKGLFRANWRPALWIALFFLLLGIIMSPQYEFGSTETFRCVVQFGVLIPCVVLVSVVNWRLAAAHIARSGRRRRRLWAALLGLFLVMMVLRVSIHDSETLRWSVNVGVQGPEDFALALCFLITAWRGVSWRLLTDILLLMLASIAAFFYFYPNVSEMLPSLESPWRLYLYRASASAVLGDAICATLLGAAISPFWLDRKTAPASNLRTATFLGTIVAIQFLGIPLFNKGSYGGLYGGILILGGVAFAAGLVFGGRALMLALFFQICYAMSLAAFGSDEWAMSTPGIIELGGVAFGFAFFGMLSNRVYRTRETELATISTAKPAVP